VSSTKKKPYDSLHIDARVVAEVVARSQPEFLSHRLEEFQDLADFMCRRAYRLDHAWFCDRVVKARGNRGRDLLYSFCAHWWIGFAAMDPWYRSAKRAMEVEK